MRKILYIVVVCFGMGSCGDFLKEYSKELVYATSCSDLDEMMIGNGYMKYNSYPGSFSMNDYYPWLHVMDDDIQEFGSRMYSTTSSGMPSVALRPFFTWDKVLFVTPNGDLFDDANWKKLYEHVGYLNVIIAQVKEFTHDEEAVRRRVTGEAQFLRAAYYYLLVNMYAPPYVKATAETDLGIPLKLTEKVEDKYFSRNSTKEVYEQIVKDLKDAADHLAGVQQANFYRVNEAAARILLSRVYLYMGEWKLASEECDKVMTLGAPLWDLNTFDMNEVKPNGVYTLEKVQYMLSTASPEVLFTQGTNEQHLIMADGSAESSSVGRYSISNELRDLYTKYEGEGAVDLRMKGYFSKSLVDETRYFARKTSHFANDVKVFDSFVIRTAEVYLNKAEAEAMLEGDAKSPLRSLLENRFKTGSIPAIDGLSGEALVKFIREERRRELCFECHRWFDLRRYAVCPKYPESKEVRHAIYEPASTAATYVGEVLLKRYAEERAYVLPIPGYEITFNNGVMVDNPERESREVMK